MYISIKKGFIHSFNSVYETVHNEFQQDGKLKTFFSVLKYVQRFHLMNVSKSVDLKYA